MMMTRESWWHGGFGDFMCRLRWPRVTSIAIPTIHGCSNGTPRVKERNREDAWPYGESVAFTIVVAIPRPSGTLCSWAKHFISRCSAYITYSTPCIYSGIVDLIEWMSLMYNANVWSLKENHLCRLLNKSWTLKRRLRHENHAHVLSRKIVVTSFGTIWSYTRHFSSHCNWPFMTFYNFLQQTKNKIQSKSNR